MLGGVYKLTAIRDAAQNWQHKLKASEQAAKTSIPGILQVRRFQRGGQLVADAIYDELEDIDASPKIVDPADLTRRKVIPADAQWQDLLVPILREGKQVYDSPDLPTIRGRTFQQLESLHPAIKSALLTRTVTPSVWSRG